jgi:polyisoprenoid-binding protein YceI
MKTTDILPILAVCLSATAFAGPMTFDFKDPKGVNNITFKLDAPLESINGSANGFSGTVTTDPETLADFSGKLVVAVDSLQVPNPIMNGHVHGEMWLDAKKYPEITFEIKKVTDVKKEGATANGEVTGVLTLHGVSKEITAPAKVTYLPGRLKDRVPNAEGDLLVIHSEFTVNRDDFDIQKGKNEDKVSNEIKISLAVAGAAPKK